MERSAYRRRRIGAADGGSAYRRGGRRGCRRGWMTPTGRWPYRGWRASAAAISLGLIVAYVNAARRGPRWVAWSTLAVGWVSFLWLAHWLGRDRAPKGQEVLGLAAWLLVLATMTEFVKVRRERFMEAEQVRR